MGIGIWPSNTSSSSELDGDNLKHTLDDKNSLSTAVTAISNFKSIVFFNFNTLLKRFVELF